jgi:hypothetical protein
MSSALSSASGRASGRRCPAPAGGRGSTASPVGCARDVGVRGAKLMRASGRRAAGRCGRRIAQVRRGEGGGGSLARRACHWSAPRLHDDLEARALSSFVGASLSSVLLHPLLGAARAACHCERARVGSLLLHDSEAPAGGV